MTATRHQDHRQVRRRRSMPGHLPGPAPTTAPGSWRLHPNPSEQCAGLPGRGASARTCTPPTPGPHQEPSRLIQPSTEPRGQPPPCTDDSRRNLTDFGDARPADSPDRNHRIPPTIPANHNRHPSSMDGDAAPGDPTRSTHPKGQTSCSASRIKTPTGMTPTQASVHPLGITEFPQILSCTCPMIFLPRKAGSPNTRRTAFSAAQLPLFCPS